MNTSIVDSQDLMNNILENKKNGVFSIKPKLFFEKIENSLKKPVPLNLNIPSSGIGSITLLEGAILVSLIKLINPKKIFEFGTFLGYSTSLFLKNTDDQCQILSIDLGEISNKYEDSKEYTQIELRSNDKKNDDFLRYTQGSIGTFYLSNLENNQKERLKLLYGDSKNINISELNLKNEVDLIFIDGGHDMETITSDTIKALDMVGYNGIIVWHDYKSSIHSDVTNFVDQFSLKNSVFHVENTMLAILFVGDMRKLFNSTNN